MIGVKGIQTGIDRPNFLMIRLGQIRRLRDAGYFLSTV